MTNKKSKVSSLKKKATNIVKSYYYLRSSVKMSGNYELPNWAPDILKTKKQLKKEMNLL